MNSTKRKKGSIKTEKPKEGFKCTICKKSGFTSIYKLKSHLFLHKAVSSRFKCTFCSKEFFRSDEYSKHMAVHTKSQKHSYCDTCGRGFVDKRNLIQHLNIHDDLPIRSTRYTCAACGANYCEERLLKYHIRKEHLNLNGVEPVYITKNLNDTWLEKVKDTRNYVQITRVKPNTLVIKKSSLKSEKVAKDSREYVEKDKKVIFQQYMSSVFAAKDNYYSRAVCDYCGKEMLKKSIVTHIRERHLKLRRFHCEVCDRTFKRHYQLCLHACGQVGKRRRRVQKLEKIEGKLET